MFTTYIITNPKNKKYIGQTNNLENRIAMHNDILPTKARFHRTTYRKGPWKILFTKDFDTRREATNFEKFLKTGSGREWLDLARLSG